MSAFGGGDILSNGNVAVPAPGHSRKDRSLSIKPLPDGRVLVFSFSPRDDRLALLRYVEQKLGISSRAPRTPIAKARPKPAPETTPTDPLALFKVCHDPTGTPVERYLARRGVLEAGRAAFGHAIRYHPKFPFGSRNVPCMVALVTDVKTAKPQAIHRTAIDDDGNKVSIDGNDRMAKGPIANGVVRLTRDEDVETCLGIAEGIETALSLQSLPEFGASPIWACLNAKGVENFPVLSGIECLWLAVDNDAAGVAAARACASRWKGAGREVCPIRPTKPETDLNDVIKEMRATV